MGPACFWFGRLPRWASIRPGQLMKRLTKRLAIQLATAFSIIPREGRESGSESSPNVRLAARVFVSFVADERSDASVSKLMPEIKVQSNVVADTALRGIAAELHTGDALRSC